MALLDDIVSPLASLIDGIIPDPQAREQAKLQLLHLDGTPELERIKARLAVVLGAAAPDPFAGRARASFLYVMYALLLWSIPLGIIAALRPQTADAIGRGMGAYLAGIPEPLYALFGTGYLGYTVAREWGKAKGK